MIEGEAGWSKDRVGARLTLPGVWWHQPAAGPGFVEIVLPQSELAELFFECRLAFPGYAATVLRLLSEIEVPAPAEWRSDPAMAQWIFNLLVLSLLLARKAEQEKPNAPHLRLAYRAAYRGRIRVRPMGRPPPAPSP